MFTIISICQWLIKVKIKVGRWKIFQKIISRGGADHYSVLEGSWIVEMAIKRPKHLRNEHKGVPLHHRSPTTMSAQQLSIYPLGGGIGLPTGVDGRSGLKTLGLRDLIRNILSPLRLRLPKLVKETVFNCTASCRPWTEYLGTNDGVHDLLVITFVNFG